MSTRNRHKLPREVAALSISLLRTVRFDEVDPVGIMWHGRFASWLEDGREAIGDKYGIRYTDFYDSGVVTPIKLYHLEFSKPLLYRKTYTITASLLWNDAAVLDYEYRITDANETCMAYGYTTQLMTDINGKLLLEVPDFYRDFCNKWRSGEFA